MYISIYQFLYVYMNMFNLYCLSISLLNSVTYRLPQWISTLTLTFSLTMLIKAATGNKKVKRRSHTVDGVDAERASAYVDVGAIPSSKRLLTWRAAWHSRETKTTITPSWCWSQLYFSSTYVHVDTLFLLISLWSISGSRFEFYFLARRAKYSAELLEGVSLTFVISWYFQSLHPTVASPWLNFLLHIFSFTSDPFPGFGESYIKLYWFFTNNLMTNSRNTHPNMVPTVKANISLLNYYINQITCLEIFTSTPSRQCRTHYHFIEWVCFLRIHAHLSKEGWHYITPSL